MTSSDAISIQRHINKQKDDFSSFLQPNEPTKKRFQRFACVIVAVDVDKINKMGDCVFLRLG